MLRASLHVFAIAVIVFVSQSTVVWAQSGQDTAAPATALLNDIEDDCNKAAIERLARLRILQGYPNGAFRPKRPVTEAEFGKILDRFAVACPNLARATFEVKKPGLATTRIRVITVLMRSVASKADIDNLLEPSQFVNAYADKKLIPAWGLKYVGYAVARGYLDDEPTLRPLQPITRSELAGILARCVSPPNTAVPYAPTDTAPPPEPASKTGGGFTGLVVDCRGLRIERSISPQIVSEGGEPVYPDPKNPPSEDYRQDVGLAAYVSDLTKVSRAGSKPLEVKAIRVQGSARQIAVVSDANREVILAEERSGHFLAKCNVTFLTDPK